MVGSILSGTGALIQGSSSLFQGDRQEKLLKKQYQMEEEHQRKMSAENWKKYNSPFAQRMALHAAGINPFVGDSSIGGMQVSSDSSSPSPMEAPDPAGGFGSSIQAGASSLFQMEQQAKLTEAEVKLKGAQARAAEASAQGQENENSIFDLTKELRSLAVGNAKLDNAIKEIEANYKEAGTLEALNEVRARIAALSADVDLKEAERAVQTKMLNKIDADIRNLDAGTKKIDAETQTENELRPLRLANLSASTELTREQRSKVAEEIRILAAEKGIKIQEYEMAQIRAWLEIQGLNQTTSLWGLIDKVRTSHKKNGVANEAFVKFLESVAKRSVQLSK